MQLKTILYEFGQICATGSTPMQLEIISCKIGRICAKGCAGNNFTLVWTNLYNRKCWKRFYASLDKSRLLGMLLSDLTDGRNSIFNFPAKTRTRICRAFLLCGGDWWWLIAKPRPIWKKAPPGLQRPSGVDSGISGVLYWPKLPVPHLGPDPRWP